MPDQTPWIPSIYLLIFSSLLYCFLFLPRFMWSDPCLLSCFLSNTSPLSFLYLLTLLHSGYVAVVNRSQKDINDELPIRQGLLKEQKFFQSHPKYRDILSKCGTVNLARSLNQILMLHIRDCLPDIKSRIMAVMASVQVCVCM